MDRDAIEKSAADELGRHGYNYLSHLCTCQVGDPGAKMSAEEHPGHLAQVLGKKGLLYGGLNGDTPDSGPEVDTGTAAETAPEE